MQVEARVAAWEPPRRILFTGPEGLGGLAFEWLVEARDGGTCIVRLVNTGFGSGEEWDDQYDGMAEGWKLFLLNLRLHMEHFAGGTATPVLPMAVWEGPREAAWARLLSELGFPASPAVGDRVSTQDGVPPLSGTVVEAESWRLALLLDDPAEGTAFVAAEGMGPAVGVSVWSYLYGPEGEATAAEVGPAWWEWLGERGLPPG
jgi:hypothetical protein